MGWKGGVQALVHTCPFGAGAHTFTNRKEKSMRIENDNGTSVNRIYVRQSWLGDALMCPERARLGSLHPELRRENDSAMMGTAVHVGIEAVLNG